MTRTVDALANHRDQVWSRLGTFLVLLLASRSVAAEPAAFAALAAKCDEIGLKEQAALTRGWTIPRPPGRQCLFIPAASDPAAPKSGAPKVVRQWYDRFLALREEQAAALFDEAKKASAAGEPTRAYQLLHEALREDPNDAEARRILGYIKNAGGQWTTPDWEKLVVETPRLNHPQLPWRAGSYHRLETPHFQIVTNHSKAEALEAGRELEKLATLWRQIFFRYWSTPEALAARIAGGTEPLSRPRPKMQVVLFKNRQEYTAFLRPSLPQAALTLGIYMHQQRTAYFFAGDRSVYPTWYHEATHQLFQEAIEGTVAEPGLMRNFWALEGAALYMESLAEHGGYWTAGGCESERLQMGRYRALTGDFLLPSQRLSALGREVIQNDPEIRKLYSQSAGLAHFLIDGAGGQHREALVDLLAAIYRGEDSSDSLAKLTGVSFADLDQQYVKSLNVTDADLAAVPNPSRLTILSLGRTQVTDKGLAHLAACDKLIWLDLVETAVTDDGLKSIAAAKGLEQLFLEGTKITGRSMPLIGGFKKLKELDLSRLPLADADLAPLAGLKELVNLYLTGTPLTDACLPHLRGLKQLELLETQGTQITPAGLKRLQASLPKLKLP